MTEPGTAGAIPANWYPDPSTPGTVRYWDGAAWTEHTRPLPVPLYVTVQAPAARPSGAPAAAPVTTPGMVPTAPGRFSSKRRRTALVIGLPLAVFALFFGAFALSKFLTNHDAPRSLDERAQAEVTSVGKAVETWYRSNSGAPPRVWTGNGHYYVGSGSDAIDAGTRSSGIDLGGIKGTGPQDWCVWVVTDGGKETWYQYRDYGGMGPGHC